MALGYLFPMANEALRVLLHLALRGRETNLAARGELDRCFGRGFPTAGIEAVLEDLVRDGVVAVRREVRRKRPAVLVTLTDAGQQRLQQELEPVGDNRQKFGAAQVRVWLALVRAALPASKVPLPGAPPPLGPTSRAEDVAVAPSPPEPPLTADDVLAALVTVDREGRWENRVPIYALRERLAGRLTRAEQDRLLLQLVAEERLRMSTIQETRLVTPEQLAQGIPSPVGGPRFYLIRLGDR